MPDNPKIKVQDHPSRLTRRSFLGNIASAGIAATATPLLQVQAASTTTEMPQAAEVSSAATQTVSLTVNGQVHCLQIEARVTLLDALRENLGLFGTKKGCDHGQCGSCTVHVNGRRVNSCLTFAVMHQDDKITTVEGLARNGELHPVQAAFLEHDAFQCGYCTSGQIMSATALLTEPCGPTDDDIRECMSGNICRCGAYVNIVAAVRAARENSTGKSAAETGNRPPLAAPLQTQLQSTQRKSADPDSAHLDSARLKPPQPTSAQFSPNNCHPERSEGSAFRQS